MFRYLEQLGLDRELVWSSVQYHLSTVMLQVTAGKPFNQVIEVAGQRVQYTAFKILDDIINVGRVHGVP